MTMHLSQRSCSMNKKMNPERRDFLKLSAAGAAGIALTSGGISKVFAASSRTAAGTAPLNKWPGRVVINFNKNARPPVVDTTKTPPTYAFNVAPTAEQITVIKKMVDDSIKLLTGQTDIGLAWKAIFPSSGANALTATSKIAIKIPLGCNSSLSAPHYTSVQAIVDGLTKMDFNGIKFPVANISFYDGACSNNFGSAGYTAANFPGISMVYGSYGANYTDGAENNASPAVKQQYSTVLHNADFLINVFSPRGHGSAFGNFTLGFKNHYGTYPPAYHDAPNGGQYLRAISCTGVVYNKNVLSICSGIFGQYEGNGPGGSPQNYNVYANYMDSTILLATTANPVASNPTTIIMGTDPISVEMQAIKMMRIQGKKNYAVADMPDYLRASGGIVVTGTNWPPNPGAPTAMDNIGVIDESKMTVLRVLNGVTMSAYPERAASSQAKGPAAFVTAKQVQGNNSTFIEFKLPVEHVGGDASISIYDMKGALVSKMSQKVLGVLNSLSWNELDVRGNTVTKGKYIVKLESGTVSQSSRFTIL
jgi:hypothetical protein